MPVKSSKPQKILAAQGKTMGIKAKPSTMAPTKNDNLSQKTALFCIIFSLNNERLHAIVRKKN
jgi:hypothetical protein